MKNELQSLANLISMPITKHFVNHEQRKLEFKYECSIIRDTLLQKVFASDSQLKTTRYIRYHHKELIALMDRFYAMCTSITMPEAFLVIMDDLLKYIEMHFRADIDEHIKISQYTLVQFQLQIADKKQPMIRQLRKNGISVVLINLLLSHFKQLEQLEELTYSAYRYHCVFLKELERFSMKRPKGNYSDQLYILLAKINFNNIHFLAHCRNQILEAVQKADKKDAQLDVLANYYKKIKLIQLRAGLSFHPDYPSVVEVLCIWINEEKVFIESRKLKQILAVTEPQLQEKIQLDLSVSQLGLFIKILMSTGVISNSQLTKILSFFTTHFKTPKVAQISTESLRNNYYEAEANTINSLKSKVIALVNELNKMK